MKKIHYVLGACTIMAVVIGIFLLLNKPDNTMGAQILPATFTDLIGTRVASTTTGVNWYGNFVASTTYPFSLLGASQASIVFDITAASSSGSAVSAIHFSILGSNDPNCSTATTSTIYNLMTKTQIRWFDASNYLYGSTAITSLSTATGTILWNGVRTGIAREISLVDLDIECLAIQMNASSTELHASYKLKD